MGHQAEAEGVRALPTLHDAQVAGGLGQALPEAQAAVILGKSVSLKEPWRQQQTRKVRHSTLSVSLNPLYVDYECNEKEVWYLFLQRHEASSNDPQSFAESQPFPAWLSPATTESESEQSFQ